MLYLLFLCHFLGDYTHLSTRKMLNAKKLAKPLLPIFYHSVVHGVLILVPLLLFNYNKIYYAFIVMVLSHFLIDVSKGLVNRYFEQTRDISKTIFWIVFGLDQFLHSVVLIIIYDMN